MAAGGVPPTVRLMAAVRALAPPAIAVSSQVPPASVNCSAKTFTAADSPPEVHQWITSARISCAPTLVEQRSAATVAAVVSLMAFLPVNDLLVIDYIPADIRAGPEAESSPPCSARRVLPIVLCRAGLG